MKRPALFLAITIALAVLISSMVVGEGYIVGRFKPPVDVRVDYTIPDPLVAPTGAVIAGSSSCTVGEAQRLAIYEMNSGGITKISPASGDLTPASGAVRTLRATRPTLNSNTTHWGVAWAKATEGFGTWRTCVTSAAQDVSTVSVVAATTTFNCLCQTGNIVQSTNTTGVKTVSRMDSKGVQKFASYNSAVPRSALTENQNWIDFSGTTLPTFSLDAGVTPLRFYPMVGNELHVCKAGCQDSTFAGAYARISGESATNRWVIVGHPGDYNETLTIAKSYVSVVGTDRGTVRIKAINFDGTGNNPTENMISNLTVGSIQALSADSVMVTRYVHGCNVGITDGSAPGGVDSTVGFLAWANNTYYTSGNVFRGTWFGMAAAGDGSTATVVRSVGDHIIVTSATGGSAVASSLFSPDERGVDMTIEGATMVLNTNLSSFPAYAVGCTANPVLNPTAPSALRIRDSSILINSTNAARNGELSIVSMPTGACTRTTEPSFTVTLDNVDARIIAADSSSTLRGVNFPNDATDHNTWKVVLNNVRLDLQGGATRYDVDMQDTGANNDVVLANVKRAQTINGSGKVYTQGGVPQPQCASKVRVGDLCANVSPALCFGTAADTWTKVSGGGACP